MHVGFVMYKIFLFKQIEKYMYLVHVRTGLNVPILIRFSLLIVVRKYSSVLTENWILDLGRT